MYHRFVRSKKPDSHSEDEKQDSPSVNLDLAAYTRSIPTIEDIMLYQSHRLTPIPPVLQNKAGPVDDNNMVDNMAGLDQSSSPDISQFCDIDFGKISPPTNINLDDELDEEFFASLAIPKVLVPPTEPGKEQQQQAKDDSQIPNYSSQVLDFPSSINLEENQKNCQENIKESGSTNISTPKQKKHKKHKKDGQKNKDRKKKGDQETQEMEETKATEETKETEEAKETKEQKKKKRKKKKEGSKKKDHKDSTDYTTTSCENTKKDTPIYNHDTITIDRNPYPVWSNKYSLYSTNMCGTNAKADTPQIPAAQITSAPADKSPAHMWQKSVNSNTAISPKLPDPSSDEFEAVYFQYNDITSILTPTVEQSTPLKKQSGNLIKEVAQEVRSYFNHPTVASTAGIGTRKSYHLLNQTPSAKPQQQPKRDIQSIINKYCPNNQGSQVYSPKPPRAPDETSQDSSTPVNNSNTPIRKFGRIIHCNPTVQLTSTLKPSPPNNITNPHPPVSSLTSSNALHAPSTEDEHSPARQPHPPTSTPRPPTARHSPLTIKPRPPTAYQRPPTSRPRPPTARQGPLTSKPQPPTASQCLLTSRPRPPTAYQRPPTSRPRPPTASQRPPTSTPRPPSARQGPLTSKPQPPTASQCPSTSRPQPPTAYQRPPTARPRPPAASQCPPTSRPRPPTAHQHLPNSKQHPPTATPRPPSSSHRPPMAKMVLLQPQKSDYMLIKDESDQLPQLSPSQTEPEEPSSDKSLKPNPPPMPQQLNREYYNAKIARRLKCVQPGGRVLERRGHKF